MSDWYLFVLFIFYLVCSFVYSNSIIYEINPSCNDCDASTTIIAHLKSDCGDIYNHFIWSFVTGFTPTLFLFETDKNAQLLIDWKTLRTDENKGSIKFENGTVHKAYGIEVTNLDFQNKNNVLFYTVPLKDLKWQDVKYDCQNNCFFQFESINNTGNVNGTFGFDSSVFTTSGRYNQIPHLAYTTSSSIFNFKFNHIYSEFFPTGEENVTFPFVSLTIAYEGSDLSGNVSKSSSINDEYSPGVFQRFVYEIQQKTNKTAFAEWRPVAYYDTERVVAKSINVGQPTVVEIKTLDIKSLLNAYFADKKAQIHHLKDFQFGSPDDSFDYRKNNFVSFTMGTGFGEIQPDSLSGTVKIVLFAGLGVPAALVIISAVYTIYLKCKSREPEFETLHE